MDQHEGVPNTNTKLETSESEGNFFNHFFEPELLNSLMELESLTIMNMSVNNKKSMSILKKLIGIVPEKQTKIDITKMNMNIENVIKKLPTIKIETTSRKYVKTRTIVAPVERTSTEQSSKYTPKVKTPNL